jgi:hypothetical protein
MFVVNRKMTITIVVDAFYLHDNEENKRVARSRMKKRNGEDKMLSYFFFSLCFYES